MARAKKLPAEMAEVAPTDATAPRPRDANGFELDSWGLPLIGPARAMRLASLGLPEPLDDPDTWAGVTLDGAEALPLELAYPLLVSDPDGADSASDVGADDAQNDFSEGLDRG